MFLFSNTKFVQTTMRLFDAIFLSIFFSFHGWFVSMELYHWLQIDFTWFCNRFCHFYNVAADIWMDGCVGLCEWVTHHDSNHNWVASVLNYHRSPSPGGRESRLLFSDYLIDIVLAPSQIKVHPCGLAPHLLLLLLQFQELMQLAAPPCLSSLPPLTGILGYSRPFAHSPVRTLPALSSLSAFIRRRRRRRFTQCKLASSSAN